MTEAECIECRNITGDRIAFDVGDVASMRDHLRVFHSGPVSVQITYPADRGKPPWFQWGED